MTNKSKEQIKQIVQTIKEYEAPIRAKDISELTGIPIKTIYNLMSDYILNSGQVLSTKSGYLAAKKGTVIMEPLKKEKKPSNKNHEGYSDPTASKAIKKADSAAWFMQGYIWNVESSSGCTYPNLIIGVNDNLEVTALPVEEGEGKLKPTEVRFTWNGNPYFVNTQRIFTLNRNKFKKAFPPKQYKDLDMTAVLSSVADFLQIPRLIIDDYGTKELRKEVDELTKELADKHRECTTLKETCDENNQTITSLQNDINVTKINEHAIGAKAELYQQAFFHLVDFLAQRERGHKPISYESYCGKGD